MTSTWKGVTLTNVLITFHLLMTQTAAQEVTGKCLSVRCLKNWLERRCNQRCEKMNWSLFLSSLKILNQRKMMAASKTGHLNLHD